MTTASQAFDVIVLGAGAAGLMCALTAGQRGRKVLLLEHADRVGAKILISGGGRCNFTNLHSAPDRFLSAQPRLLPVGASAATRKPISSPWSSVTAFAYHEKTLGQLFCDGSARAIVAMLLAECARGGVDVRTGHAVTDISRPDGFRLETSHGCFTAPALVLATGGLSIPKMGATGFAHAVARRFGLRVVEPLPALVPLDATPQALGLDQVLAGVSLEAIVSCAAQSFRESILFTHHGLSGPAILQISSYWRPGDTIRLDLAPGCDANAFLMERKRSRPRAEPKTVLAEILPVRLAHALAQAYLPSEPMATVPTALWRPLRPGSRAGKSGRQARGGGPRPR